MASVAALKTGRPVIPVVQIDDADDAVPLAEALVEGGLDLIEVTLRTAAAAEAVRRIARAVPQAILGIGTATRVEHVALAADLGARFLVSPGITARLATAAGERGMPYLPGVTSPSEIMLAQEFGLAELKFFPAVLSGGAPMLAAFAPVFPDIRFCPTGGIGPQNLAEFLALPNVFAVGGSWMVGRDLLRGRRWGEVRQRAQAAADQVTGIVRA